jgi:hypothetical protein
MHCRYVTLDTNAHVRQQLAKHFYGAFVVVMKLVHGRHAWYFSLLDFCEHALRISWQ